jgi:hypothetical protein
MGSGTVHHRKRAVHYDPIQGIRIRGTTVATYASSPSLRISGKTAKKAAFARPRAALDDDAPSDLGAIEQLLEKADEAVSAVCRGKGIGVPFYILPFSFTSVSFTPSDVYQDLTAR